MNRASCFAPLLRLLPSAMRGKQRLARWLIGGSRALQAELTLVTRAGQRLTAPNGLEPIAFSLLISGEYEPEVLESGALDFIAFEFLDWAEQRVPGHRPGDAPVSYTHLTLPTNREV